MHKIILDGKEVQSFVPESLPMLIHGTDGSGASLYTICLAAQWFSQGWNIEFLCGYPMAEEAFTDEVGEHANARFYTQEKVDEFIETLKNPLEENTVVFVKNIELFDDRVFDAVSRFENIIISGDVAASKVKEKVLNKKFVTEVYFSELTGKELPELEKYQGFMVSENYNSVTQLSE